MWAIKTQKHRETQNKTSFPAAPGVLWIVAVPAKRQ